MLPGDEFCYGKRLRPQTPVGGIISNHYGEAAGSELQQRYQHMKGAKSITAHNQVRMTHCQLGMDAAIKTKYIDHQEQPSVETFKLQRFTKNIEPKTSTKRGEAPYMSSSATKK